MDSIEKNNDIKEISSRIIKILDEKIITTPGPREEMLFNFDEIYDKACIEHFYKFDNNNSTYKTAVKKYLKDNNNIIFVNGNLIRKK